MRIFIWALALVGAACLSGQASARRHSPVEARGAQASLDLSSNRQAPTAQAGASLAGVSCSRPLPWQKAKYSVGSAAAVLGPVVEVSVRDDVRGQPVFISIGQPFPFPDRFDLLIWGPQRHELASWLASLQLGQEVCALGKVELYKGVPQIVLQDRAQVQFF